MRRLALGLVWISVTAALVGFFLPWVTVALRGRELASLAEAVSGGDVTLEIRRDGRAAQASLSDLIDAPRTIRGWDILFSSRKEELQIASALLEVVMNSRQDLAARGAAVILVPVAALITGVLLTVGRTGVRGSAAVALVCAAAAGLGTWKAATLGSVGPLAITVEEGLVLSVLAYAGLAIAAGWLSILTMQGRREA